MTCSDDGSLDVWDVTAGVGTALRHVHGKTAHDALVGEPKSAALVCFFEEAYFKSAKAQVSGVASSSGRAEVASSSWDKRCFPSYSLRRLFHALAHNSN